MTEQAQKIIDDWTALQNTKACLLLSGLTCRRLPPFPSNVEWIVIRWMTLDALPAIPDSVRRFVLWGVNVDEVPALPNELEYLALAHTSVRILPRMPCMNRWIRFTCQLYIADCPRLLIPYTGQFSYEYAALWGQWWGEQPAARQRTTQRCATIKDELLARRVDVC